MDNLDIAFINKLKAKEKEYDEISQLLESVEIMMDNKLFLYYQKKYKLLEKIVSMFKEYKKMQEEIETNKELILIEESLEIKNELENINKNLEESLQESLSQMKMELAKKKESENQKVQVELNFKSGKLENKELFYQLFDGYCRLNNSEITIKKQTDTGYVFEFTGDNIYEDLSVLIGNVKIISFGKESVFGVAVISIKENNFTISIEDCEIETLKSDGAGGQHINKTESGIRLIHKPTGIVSVCKDERSQGMNKKRAFENLEKKILEKISKDSKNDMDFQRKNIKNALFSSTPALILNFDRNIASCYKTKKDYNLKQILNGELNIISSDVIING